MPIERVGGKYSKTVFVMAVTLVITVLFALVAYRPKERVYVIYGAFDTEITLTAKTRTAARFNKAAEVLEENVRELHAAFDAYHSAYIGYDHMGNLKTVNESGGEAVKVPPPLYKLLEFCAEADIETGGAVNAAFGNVTRLWKEAAERGSPPSLEELRKAAENSDMAGFELYRDEGFNVRRLNTDTTLDVGATAKGFAAERCAEILKVYLDNFILNAGGNVICYGDDDYGIGIMNPNAADGFTPGADAVLMVVSVRNKAVVTSGSYERFFIYEGKRYGHIIDPKTLQPAHKYQSVTVIADSGGIADMLSTALFILDDEAGRRLLAKYGAEAVWVYDDGHVVSTSGIVFGG